VGAGPGPAAAGVTERPGRRCRRVSGWPAAPAWAHWQCGPAAPGPTVTVTVSVAQAPARRRRQAELSQACQRSPHLTVAHAGRPAVTHRDAGHPARIHSNRHSESGTVTVQLRQPEVAAPAAAAAPIRRKGGPLAAPARPTRKSSVFTLN
jgi:hypothetical protein